MINLLKNEDANSRYAPGVVYVVAPDLRYGQLVKDAFGASEQGLGVEPLVLLSIQDTGRISLTAKRMNVRSRYSDSVQTMSFDVPEADAAVQGRVDVFASRWFDLTDPIVGDVELAPTEAPRKGGVDPMHALIAFYVMKFHRMPPMKVMALIGAEPLGLGSLSRIEIDKDTRVCLPELLSAPLPLNPLQRTVYMLFMRHPQGIVLKDIMDYGEELRQIYRVLRPNCDNERVRSTIENLYGPEGTLHQQLSRIKTIMVRELKNSRLADVYAIQGRHSSPYAIAGVARGEVEMRMPAWLEMIPRTVVRPH